MKGVRWVGFVVALCAVLLYVSLPCACVTLVDITNDALAEESRRALDAQQAFYARHERYARTITELGFTPLYDTDLQIEFTSSTEIVMRSASLLMPEATCSLVVRPDINSLDGLICSQQ